MTSPTNGPQPSFAHLRLICLALVMGMTMFTIVVAVVLHQNDGRGLAEPTIPVLDDVALFLGIGAAVTAFGLRSVLLRPLEGAEGAARTMIRFRGTIVPIAMLEGGCLFGITVWMLNGNEVPALATALVLLSLAIVIVPFSDPDATAG
jgi:hypothetical protein